MAIATTIAQAECDAEALEHEHDVVAGLMAPSWSPECWSDAEHADLVCRKVLDITHDVKSFLFEAPEGRVFRFDPGQFITLQLEIDGQHVSRCYTISSPPTRPHPIAITVKRVVGGPVSNWLHDNVFPGARIAVQAPLGSFTIAGQEATKYLFLSAGSGITLVMSMTRALYDLGSDADILFIHSADAGRHHLPPRTRRHGVHDAEHPGGAHMRRRPPVRTLAWASWPTLNSGAAGSGS
jgi:Oxidoreductase FAD-binding domain